jgi:hypothetical protein
MKVFIIWLVFSIPVFCCASENSGLCYENETSVWACESKNKSYFLCVSKGINATSGYMQYRVGSKGAVSFRFPETLKHPKGLFSYELLARGGMLTFNNSGYQYEIVDQLIGSSKIEVSKAGKSIAEIDCGQVDPGIIATSTIELFKLIGIAEQ